MLSISNVGAAQASSYYEKDGYYARLDDTDNRWQGHLTEDLNLPDNVVKADFDKLVNERKERAGYDLCFSAPKSVSVAMTVNESVRQDMIHAHNAAVTATLEQIEQREIVARVTKDGVTQRIKTRNMIAGLFNHYVSRNSDPQLHTHSVILNKTKYNGKYYAADNEELYKNKILYGQIYRNTLARELMNKGYEITVTDLQKGFFELRGIDKNILDQFSSRRQEIVQKLKEWGNNTPEAAGKAAIMTRQAKEHKDMNILMGAWKASLNEIKGADIQKANAPITPTLEQQKAEFVQAVCRLERQSFAFTEKDLKRAVLAAGVGSGMSEVQYNKIIKSDARQILVPLGIRKDKADGKVYYTTGKNLAIEKEIFNEVARTKTSMPGLERKNVKKSLQQALEKDKTSLSDQQSEAALGIATTKDQYFAVQGFAGTGKTHMLNYTRQVLEDAGYEVKGACYTGKAAQGLQEDAKILSSTIHSFLNRLEREAGNQKAGEDMQIKTEWDLKGLKPGTVKEAWIVDEASMVDNATMKQLMEAAKAKQAKVIFVGDRQQLLPVGVGNAFSVLIETGKIKVAKLDEIRRQKNKNLLLAVKEAVKGDLSKSLELIDKDTKVIAKHNERMKVIVADYTGLTPVQQEKTVVLTSSNKDRRLLNEAIRQQLKKQGILTSGTEFKTQDGTGRAFKREFSIGDKLIFLQNDNRLNIRNGQTGVIAKIESNFLFVKSGDREIVVDTEQYNKLDHGYAMTTHKSQGITTDRILINLDSSQRHLNSRNAFYVDISRAKYEVKVYADDKKKVSEQIQEFAKKVTSEDFLIHAASGEMQTPTQSKKLPLNIPFNQVSIKSGNMFEFPIATGINGKPIYLSELRKKVSRPLPEITKDSLKLPVMNDDRPIEQTNLKKSPIIWN